MDSPKSQAVEGYPRLACHMARYSENAVFKRFGSLGTRNLLYLQAELVHLERKLCRLEAADSTSSEGRRAKYSKDWYWLNNSQYQENDEQLKTVLSIRHKLKEYYDAIVQQSVINGLMNPDNYDLSVLQDWIERPAFGNLALIGADRETWGRLGAPSDPHADLLTLNATGRKDSFTQWFSHKFIVWFHYALRSRCQTPGDLEVGIVSYSSGAIERCASFVTNIVASLLPIISIVILYCAPSMKLRLGLVVLFTLLFTVCVSTFSSAKRGEIFMATSTFAAVQVVFISTNNGWSNST